MQNLLLFDKKPVFLCYYIYELKLKEHNIVVTYEKRKNDY